VSESPLILGILTDPGLLITLAPLGVIFLGVITFEIAMGVTISTLPRSRFQQKWTPQEQHRVLRVFGVVFSVWPITAGLIIAHVYAPFWLAILADGLVVLLIAACIRWFIHGKRQRQLILAGHCESCLYDLRASHENQSDHCPECGAELYDHPTRVAMNR